MEIPRHIKASLDKREKAAKMFNEHDLIVSQWCMNNGVELEEYDCFGGVEAIVNPYDSKKRILEAIEKA